MGKSADRIVGYNRFVLGCVLKRSSALATLLLLVARVSAQPVSLVDKGPYGLVDEGRSGIQDIPIWLASAKGTQSVRVSVQEVKDPNGARLPGTAIGTDCAKAQQVAPPVDGSPAATLNLKSCSEDLKIFPQGSLVSLHIMNAALFAITGDYPVKLLVAISSEPQTSPAAAAEITPSVLLSITLHRETATLGVDSLQDLVLPVSLTWSQKNNEFFTLPLTNLGRMAVRELSINVQPLRLKPKKELMPTTREERLAGDTAMLKACAPRLGTAVTCANDMLIVPARGQVDLRLEFPHVHRAGSFQTAIELVSPSLGSVVRIPLTIEVSHHWFGALLIIFIGVSLGFLVNVFSKKWRPTQQNLMQILRLRAELQRIEAQAEELATRQVCIEIHELLQQADAQNKLGVLTTAKELYTQAGKRLDDLLKEWSAKLDAAATKRRELLDRLTALRAQPDLPADVAAQLKEAEEQLAAVESLLVRRRADVAQTKLRMLEALVVKLESARTAAAASPTRGAFDTGPALPSVPQTPRFTLLRPEPQERHEVNTELLFVVLDSQSGGGQPIGYEWNFDRGPSDEPPTKIGEKKYTFTSPGEYWVTVTIRFEGKTPVVVPLKITIHPSRTQRDLAEVSWRIASADLLLSGLSLIIATGTGLVQLYLNGSFGTPEQYFNAFLWGVGVDSSVRGASAVLQRFSGES